MLPVTAFVLLYRLCRHLYPADHDMVIEEQYVERQEAKRIKRTAVAARDVEEAGGGGGAKAGGAGGGDRTSANAHAAFHVFDQHHNKGELGGGCGRGGDRTSANARVCRLAYL